MRALLVMLLAGCAMQGSAPSDDDGYGGWHFPGGSTEGRCRSDGACSSGDLCARDGTCLSPAQIYPAHVMWTLSGQPAGKTACDASPDLEIGFYTDSGDGYLGYAPVPCIAGKFTVDKLPRTYRRVRLGRDPGAGDGEAATIDGATGDAVLDLPY